MVRLALFTCLFGLSILAIHSAYASPIPVDLDGRSVSNSYLINTELDKKSQETGSKVDEFSQAHSAEELVERRAVGATSDVTVALGPGSQS